MKKQTEPTNPQRWNARTRREFFAAAAASIGVLAMSACGSSDSNSATAPSPTPTPAPVPGPGTYSTSFPLTEKPISEGGKWLNRGTPPWTYVQTVNGLAYGTNGANDTYDDSYAYLLGFGPDQQGEAVIAVNGSAVTDPHETELLLRWADSATTARGYECSFNYVGEVQIVRWNGQFGDFFVLPATGASLGRNLRTNDVVRATIVGNTITCYINNVQIAQATDSTWTDGQPGIGFFKRPQGANSALAYSSYAAASL